MNKYKRNITLLICLTFSIIFFSCYSPTNSVDIDCKKQCAQANFSISKFYLDSNIKHLDTALFEIEKIYNDCEKNRNYLANLKITALLLKNEYNWGYRYVDSLSVSDFSAPYKKNLYLLTFKALLKEKESKIEERNNIYIELVDELQKYSKNHKTDKEVVLDIFYTKKRFQSLSVIENELDSLKKQHSEDSLFYDVLKETILSTPKSMEAQTE